MIVVSVYLPSDALSQGLLSYWDFSYLRCGVSLHGCSSKVQPLYLTLDMGCLLTATTSDFGLGYLFLAARCSSTACRSNHVSLQSKMYTLGYMYFHFKIYIYLTGQQGIFSSRSFANFLHFPNIPNTTRK